MIPAVLIILALVVVVLLTWEFFDFAIGYTLRPRWFRRWVCWFAGHDAGHPDDGPNEHCLRCGGEAAVTRQDLIAFEQHQAATYRREAKKRGRNKALAARLNELADASAARAEEFRSGPLFRGRE